MYFQPNISHQSEQEAAQLAQVLTVVADQMFTRPDILREIFFSIDLRAGHRSRVAPNSPLRRDALFATAGDRYDAQHVFEHYYSTHTERGGNLDRVHINVNFHVLHDSMFRINQRLAGMVFKLLLNREIRRRGLPNRWLRPVDSIGVFCNVYKAYTGGDAQEEYQVKDDAEFRGAFTRRRPNATRGGQPATKVSRPLVAQRLPITPI
jgi:hypothetical protein